LTRTEIEPGARLWASLPAYDQRPGVLHAALFVGFAWVDEERAHAAAVVTGTDRPAIEAAARQIAQAYWDARQEFHFGTPSGTIDECIAAAQQEAGAPVFLSDGGDNVTAGAVGDSPLVLERLLAHRIDGALVAGLCDADAVTACESAGAGATIELTLGGRLDPHHGTPLPVRATVRNIVHVGEARAQAIVQVEGVTVVVTRQRQSFTTRADFARAQVDPLAYKIAVVKLGYLFPELLEMAAAAYLMLSPGACDLDLARLPYQRIVRPIFPADPEFDWRASDRGCTDSGY
jgi:microcystin degradation protein MlrC